MPTHIQIADIEPRISYTVGASPQDTFTVPFPFFANGNLRVYVDGVLKTLTTHYTVTGALDSDGGTVTFEDALTDCQVVIIRRIAIERTTDFPASGPLQTPSLNTDLDRIVAIEQEIAGDVERALRLGEMDALGEGVYDAGGQRIGDLAPGTEGNDAATVAQVQSAVLGIAPIDDADALDALLSPVILPGRLSAWLGQGADDRAAILQAIADAPGNRIQGRPGATYLFSDGFTPPDNMLWDLNGATLKLEGGGTSSHFSKSTSVGATYTIASLVNGGFITTTPVTDIAAGDTIICTHSVSADRFPCNRRKVTGVSPSGGGSLVTLENSLELDENTFNGGGYGSLTLRVQKVGVYGAFGLTNGEVDLTDIDAGVLNVFGVAGFDKCSFSNLDVVAPAYELTSGGNVFAPSYVGTVVLKGVAVKFLNSNGGILGASFSGSVNASRIEWNGDCFGLASSVCDHVDYRSVFGAGHYRFDPYNSVRGVRNIGCRHQYLSDIHLQNYDSGIKVEDCGRSIIQGAWLQNCNIGINISNQNDTALWSDTIVNGAVIDDCINAIYAPNVLSRRKLFNNVIVNRAKKSAIILQGKELLLNNIVVNGWGADGGTGDVAILVATASGVVPTGSVSNVTLIKSAGAVSPKGIVVPTNATSFKIDDATISGDITPLFDTRPGAFALTDGATIDLDYALSQNGQFEVTLGGNRTMNAPTRLIPGRLLSLDVVQDGTGSRTITWNAAFKFPGGVAPTLSTAINARDTIVFKIRTASVLDFVSIAKASA